MGPVHKPSLVAAALLVGLTAAPFEVPVAGAAPVSSLDQVLSDAVAADGVPGAIAVVYDGHTLSRHWAGVSDVATGAEFTPNTHVRAGSVSKAFVAAMILQLVAEGRIDLDAPIEVYLPGRVRGEGIDPEAITVRQVLRHQSGLPEYFDSVTDVPTEPVTGEQLLDMALTRPAGFAPGEKTVYTNTNYVVAGLIAEAVTETPVADEVTRRVIAPLGLRDTYWPAPDDTGLRKPFAHGYENKHGVRTDVTDFNASAAGMSGSLVSTGEDMAVFVSALLAGRVVPPAQLADMMDTVELDSQGRRYGLGLGSIDLSCGVRVWGHGGDIPGFHTLMVAPQGGPALTVTVTQGPETGDPREQAAEAFYCT